MNNTRRLFMPNNSFLHKVNPRFKIFAFIITSASVFMAPGLTGLVVMVLFAMFVNVLGLTPFKAVRGIVKAVIVMFILTVILNVLIINPPEDENWHLLFKIWGLPIYTYQLILATQIALRIFILLLFGTALIQSTGERAMTEGITWLLSPLKIFKFPVSEIGIMITIAIRFIPTLINESKLIMRSQAARGVSWYTGTISEKLRALSNLFLPLFVTNFTRADDISNAMIARGYVVNEPRTNYFSHPITWRGWAYALLLVSMISLILVMRYVPDFPLILDFDWRGIKG